MTNSVPNPHVVNADTLTGELRPLRRTAFALGSNLGDRLEYLQAGVDTMTDPDEIIPVGVSPVYETVPVGGPEGQPMFLNAVLVVETTLSPRSLMERAQSTEVAYGRTRDAHDHKPRTLDIDVLAVGDLTTTEGDLEVPHPRISGRAFVLVPWADVDPDFVIPSLGRVGDLSSAVDASGVTQIDDKLELPSGN